MDHTRVEKYLGELTEIEWTEGLYSTQVRIALVLHLARHHKGHTNRVWTRETVIHLSNLMLLLDHASDHELRSEELNHTLSRKVTPRLCQIPPSVQKFYRKEWMI